MSSAREAIAARAQAILAKHGHPANPVADDEARRMGERPEREALPSDPDLTHDAALANLRAGLGEHFAEPPTTRLRTDDGQWLDPATGVVTDKINGTPS